MITVESNSEVKLVEMARSIGSDCAPFCAACFFFSKLSSRYKNKYQVKIAINIIKNIFFDSDGCIFLLSDLDVFLIFNIEDKELFNKSVYQLRHLFIEDPIINLEHKCDHFFNLYDLSIHSEQFIDACQQKLLSLKLTNKQTSSFQSLSSFESRVKAIDLKKVLDVQSICSIKDLKNQEIFPIYDLLFIDIEKLCQNIGVTREANTTLNKYLTSILDDLILEMVSSNSFKRPIGINIKPYTILSENFLKFHKKIIAVKKPSSVVIELEISDLFLNTTEFLKSKELLTKLGYRICTNSIHYIDCLEFNESYFEKNLIKLSWNLDFNAHIIQNKTRNLNNKRTIISNCNDIQTIKIGLLSGISLFQGKYIEKILNEKNLSLK